MIKHSDKKVQGMAKIKAEIVVKGSVQKAGYRDYVQEEARSLNVKGYVENQRDGSVRIVCEADEETLKNFLKLINIKQDLIAVEEIETIKKQPATGKYEYFDIKYGPLVEELGEGVMPIVKILVLMHNELKKAHESIQKSVKKPSCDAPKTLTIQNQDSIRW